MIRVSVVVPTRNRHAQLAACLATILRCDPFELIVVDQSDEAAPHVPDDPRITWLRCPPRGVCVARNLGILASRGEVIANTDDDCAVPPDWIARIAALFEADGDAALVCGRVHLPEGAVGYAASFEPRERELQGRLPAVEGAWGLSANLSVRRSVLEKVGLFDGMMGVGSDLRSGGETELILRVLRAGMKVVNAAEIDVLHLGVRAPGEASSRLLRQYAFGTAAGLMKHVRLGDAEVRALFLGLLGKSLRWNLSALRGVWPAGFSHTLWFLFGAVQSLQKPIDRATGLYECAPVPERKVPSLSVVIPTRNRPSQIAPCLEAVLKSTEPFEVLVVDQSDDDGTERAVASFQDPRVRCLRSPLRGTSNGRNTGIAETTGEVIAFTDDDCRPAPDWCAKLLEIFSTNADAAAVCGRVVVPEELLLDGGFAAAFEPLQRVWQGEYPEHATDWGISANMSLRRSALERVGAFDTRLGPGAPLLSGEEYDLLYRLLRAGLKVINAREVLVIHLGVRQPGEEMRKLWHDYAAGTGAALFKHVRLGDIEGLGRYMHALSYTLRGIALKTLQGKRPVGAGYLRAFIKGSASSYRFKVDRKTRMYSSRD